MGGTPTFKTFLRHWSVTVITADSYRPVMRFQAIYEGRQATFYLLLIWLGLASDYVVACSWNLLLQPLMLGRQSTGNLLAVHWLSLYKHARIQRIAMVTPIRVLVQSSFESIQWWSRHHLTW